MAPFSGTFVRFRGYQKRALRPAIIVVGSYLQGQLSGVVAAADAAAWHGSMESGWTFRVKSSLQGPKNHEGFEDPKKGV